MTESFPAPQARAIYLDHHASTPILPEVLEAMQPWLEKGFGNPSNSLHEYGRDAREVVEWAKRQVAALINANPDQIIFTAGATESNNLALRGYMQRQPLESGLVISALEHESIMQPARFLEKSGYTFTLIQANNTGMITADAVRRVLLDAEVPIKMLSVIAVQGEIGTINPIPEIAKIASDFGTVMHTDAAQAVGKIPVDVSEWDVDFVTIAAHKMYGPKGIGVLYVKDPTSLTPILHGAGHEGGLRPGTENVPSIAGFGMACQVIAADLEQEAARQREIRDYLWNTIHKRLPEARLNGHPEKRHPGNLHFSLPDVNSVELLNKLPRYALSVGSACHTDHPMDNPLIEALGIPERYAQGSIRVGIGRSNTKQELQQFVENLVIAYHQISEKSSADR